MEQFNIVIPAKNEANSLKVLLPKLISRYQASDIIVVNDGSTDDTEAICRDFQVQVISHPYSKGNGAAIKSGARLAARDIIVFMDADGQHEPASIEALVGKVHSGYDMVIGARARSGQANIGRWFGNILYNRLASWMTGHQILDLTSGFRAVNRKKFLNYLFLLPNGFSYPTTITMAFFRIGYSVSFIPIHVNKREGKSHLKFFKDGMRFLVIIFKVGTLYSPMRIFFPVALLFFLVGCFYYGYTYFMFNRFTNMSAVLFISSVIVFLVGLVSEQVTTLIYKEFSHDEINQRHD